MFEQDIKNLIQEFRTAIYGKDVRRTYADIAELVCIRAMKELDHAVEQGNLAEQQGDYAKAQGDYAKNRGNYAKEQTDTALAEIVSTMLSINNEFGNIQQALESTENGALLLEINELLKDMYRMATDEDVEKIIEGTYVDEDRDEGIFETGTNQDIDDIITGTYTGYNDEGGIE